jgi:hypothetical protein
MGNPLIYSTIEGVKMADGPSQWRETDARAKEERAESISDWLVYTEDLLEMLANDEDLAKELRGVIGRVKTKKSDLMNEAATLRARIHTRGAAYA